MNGQQLAPMTVGFAIAVVLILVIGFFRRKRNMIAHLAPVKRELKKEKQWLRRGEYNAAMVKGRQNLELFLNPSNCLPKPQHRSFFEEALTSFLISVTTQDKILFKKHAKVHFYFQYRQVFRDK